MPEKQVQSIENSPLQRFTEQLNLPALIAGPAGKAISRLIAGVIEIPAAFLDSFAQDIKNKTKARELVNNEVGLAAARFAANDKDIVARAAHNLLAKEYRKQKNKEEIAMIAIEALKTEFGLPDSPTDCTPSDDIKHSHEYVDEDWLNIFEKYAEDASTERMQSLWGKILAGEIRSPKTFSLKTLRFISELDQQTAELFEKYVQITINNEFIIIDSQLKGQPFDELVLLQNAGLISGVGANVTIEMTFYNSSAQIYSQGRAIVLHATENHTFEMTVALLSSVGKEVSKLTRGEFNLEKMRHTIDKIPKCGLKRIQAATKLAGDGVFLLEEIWVAPVPGDKKTS